MKILVHQEDIKDIFNTPKEQLWRSLEHFLDSHSREFIFKDFEKTVEIKVSDKSDAVRLMSQAAVGLYQVIDNGSTTEIQATTRKPGRPKNAVFDSAIGKSLTQKQYQKHLVSTSLSKAEILKRGILTKPQLEKGLASGSLQAITIGKTQRITQASLHSYVHSLLE